MTVSNRLAALIVSVLLMQPNVLADDASKSDAEVLNSIGEVELGANHFKNAIEKLSESLILDPKLQKAKKNLAIAHYLYAIYLGKQSRKDLFKEIHQSLLFDPNLGQQKLLNGLLSQMNLNPSSSLDRADLGDYLFATGDLAGAAYEYGESIRLRNSSGVRKKAATVKNKILLRKDMVYSLNLLIRSLNKEFEKPGEVDLENADRISRQIVSINIQIDDYFADAMELAAIHLSMENLSYAASKFLHDHNYFVTRSRVEIPQHASSEIPPLLEPNEVQYVLSDDDIKFGEEQLKQMLYDRPEMSLYIKKGDAVWNWCVRQFAGECTPARYLWCGTASKIIGLPGWHCNAVRNKSGLIGVQTIFGSKPDAEDYWCSAIFELFNIRNDSKFAKNNLLKQDHAQWVKERARLEYNVVKRVADFHAKYWIPHCEDLGLSTDEKKWYSEIPGTFDKWFRSLPSDSPYLKLYGGK